MLALSLILLAGLSPQPTGKPVDTCAQFLTGHWLGKGVVSGFGKPMKVDNDYLYRPDGSFATINRYLGSDGKWTEQKVTGRWSATRTKAPRVCTLLLEGSGPSAGSSSSSTFQMIGYDTFRSLGFDMKRVK